MRNVLVVANETVVGKALIDRIQEHTEGVAYVNPGARLGEE